VVPDVETPVEVLEEKQSNTVSIIKNTSNIKYQKPTTE